MKHLIIILLAFAFHVNADNEQFKIWEKEIESAEFGEQYKLYTEGMKLFLTLPDWLKSELNNKVGGVSLAESGTRAIGELGCAGEVRKRNKEDGLFFTSTKVQRNKDYDIYSSVQMVDPKEQELLVKYIYLNISLSMFLTKDSNVYFCV
ncbi:hypothetical protein L2735_14130 [Shewanella olleyana]|uniref:hypothetical protein n=1 Tax=Shewanella olleyana TaxID=135626 RepID=UPI00200D3E41|nr:hypothetical protein [Shewanella olleyana]MCL1067929.1 hypothetical protein [Shewanella olleyana]